MAVRFAAAAACLAALGSGCVIREIREIHHEPAASNGSSSCDACASSAPGSVLADSQPPSPMVEEAGEPPAQDHVWVDGYWHWNGAEWIWISGRWVPPMGEFVFVPPSYYASGASCVYVPGFWQRGPIAQHPIRDRRPISVRGHSHGGRPHKPHRPRRGFADHRGDKPSNPTGSNTRGGGDEIVVPISPSPRPERVAPPRPTAGTPAWRQPGSAAPAARSPVRPGAPPPASARPGPWTPPRVAMPPGPGRVAPPQGPSRAAPPSSSPPPRSAPSAGPARPAPPPAKAAPPPSAPPRPAPPPRPAQSAGGSSSKKK